MSTNLTKKSKCTLRPIALLLAGFAGLGLAMTAPASLAQNHQSMPGMDMGSPSVAPPKAKPRAPQAKKSTPKTQPKKKSSAARPAKTKGKISTPAMDHSQMKGMDDASMPLMDQIQPASKKDTQTMDPNMPGVEMKGADDKSMPPMDHIKSPSKDKGSQAMNPNMPGMTAAGNSDKTQMKDMQSTSMQSMDTSTMQGGSAPPDARDADAYADGLVSGPMPGMDMADHEPFGMLLLDKFEYADSDQSLRIDGEAFYGGDYNKLWLKADGGRAKSRLAATRLELLWDRIFATYWSTQLGVRRDVGEGPPRNWAAFGVQGLAPYWFDVDATVYVGESGRSAMRVEASYDLLFTQRLILQPNLELNLYGKNDPAREIGTGLSDIDFGLRLRYEIRRQLAPYIGVNWKRKFGTTADFARAAGKDTHDTQLVTGVRIWF